MTQINASVIIPTHNRKNILFKTLKALNNQTYSADNFEIIIINDGSTDGTEEMINNFDSNPNILYKYIEQSGPAGARNRGIEICNGNIVIFIDDDIIVNSEFIDSHVETQQKQEKIIAHGPVIHTNNLDNPKKADKKITDFSSAFFATGNASIKKKYLIEAGLFNEAFDKYGWEDLEMGKRLKKLDLKKVDIPEAKGYHYKPEFSLKQVPKILQKEKERGLMAVKYHDINSSLSVKFSTLYWKPFFILKKILTIGNWPHWKITSKILKYAHQKNYKNLRSFILYFMKLNAYFKGMKEADNN